MARERSLQELRLRVAHALRGAEHLLYVAIAAALILVGGALFVSAVVDFVTGYGDSDFASLTLELLEALLLVFIITELLHTVRAVIAENVLLTEPFLIVGIVAAIRRIIVISADASDDVGGPDFRDLMLEMGVLVGVVLFLGVTIYLLRNTRRSEPRPSHEPEEGDEG